VYAGHRQPAQPDLAAPGAAWGAPRCPRGRRRTRSRPATRSAPAATGHFPKRCASLICGAPAPLVMPKPICSRSSSPWPSMWSAWPPGWPACCRPRLALCRFVAGGCL